MALRAMSSRARVASNACNACFPRATCGSRAPRKTWYVESDEQPRAGNEEREHHVPDRVFDPPDALIEQYKALVSTLPKVANLEVMVVTKKELMRKFRVKEEAVETTFQINAICKNVSQMLPETVVHVYIDECWVTVPKRFSPHLTCLLYTSPSPRDS